MTLLDEDIILDLGSIEDDDEFTHYFCACSPDVAYCGTPLDGSVIEGDNDPPDCVVCYAMRHCCPRCGLED
jgi:hypothetical protein